MTTRKRALLLAASKRLRIIYFLGSEGYQTKSPASFCFWRF